MYEGDPLSPSRGKEKNETSPDLGGRGRKGVSSMGGIKESFPSQKDSGRRGWGGGIFEGTAAVRSRGC